jgi:transposase-like protein
VFEDLINKKVKTGANMKCIYCDSYLIFRYKIEGINGQYRQKLYCTKCNKVWYIIYNSKREQTDIIHAAKVVG